MKKKTFRILAVVFALLGALSSLFGVIEAVFFEYGGFVPGMFDKFTILSNILYAIVAVIAALFLIRAIKLNKESIPVWVEAAYLVGVVCLTLTMGVVYGYLAWFTSIGVQAMIGLPAMLFVHTVSPVLAIVSFLFFLRENKLRMNDALICLALPLAYGLVWVGLQLFKVVDSSGLPYPFLDISVEWWKPTVWFAGLALGTGLVSVLWIFVHNYGIPPVTAEAASPEKKAVASLSEEPKGAETVIPAVTSTRPLSEPTKKKENQSPKVGPEKPADQPLGGPTEKPEAAEAPSSAGYKDGARVYHISAHPGGGWQVKLATGGKAIKIFKTQAEAIDYAKGLEKTQGGSIRIHSVKGTIRKE